MGRGRELAAIERAVGMAERGQSRVLLLSGQAGIGKSRLTVSAATMAKARGFTVLKGQSSPLQGGLAYAPVVEAMRRHLGTLPERESAALLAGLHDLAGLISDPRLTPGPPGAPELERTRMFEAALRLVERITAKAPALMVVDDLHWADHGTIELLHHIGRGSRGRRLLLLCAYRSAEPGGPLATLAMTVRREQTGAEIALDPLPDNDVAELVGQLLGAAPRPELLYGVTSRAKGVPLFVTALVADGKITQDASALPVIVRDVVLDRLQRLDDPARRLIEVIAVAGGAGTPKVLRTVLPDLDLDPLLRHLVGQGLVDEQVVGPALTYRVSHPLYAEVSYAELTVGQRRLLHATIAGAIDDVLSAAPHYREAGDLVDSAKASEVLGAAGQRALDVYDAQEALNYFSAALNHGRLADRTDLIPELMNGLARALQGSGRLDDAATMWIRADKLAEQAGDSLRQRLIGYYRAMLESERGKLPTPVRPVPFADDDPPVALLVHWLVALREGNLERYERVVDAMTRLTERDDSHAAHSVAHFGASMAARIGGDYAGAYTQNQLALEAAELTPSVEAGYYTYAPQLHLPALNVIRGDIPAALRAVDNPGETQVQFEIPGAVHYVRYTGAICHFVSGDLPGALDAAEVSLDVAKQVGEERLIGRALALRSLLLAEQGKLGPAEDDLKRSLALGNATQHDLTLITRLAATAFALHSGRHDEAPEPVPPSPMADLVIDWLRVAYTGYLAVARGDVPAAEEVAGHLSRGGRTAPFLEALAHRQSGLVHGLAGREQQARDLLRRAATRFGDMGAVLLSAQADLEAAELGDTVDADVISRCTKVFTDVGATALLRRARELTGVTALSRREHEIVRLVGEGLSNAQIAERLFLSERTIETHLHNSYKKLRIGTRGELTRWARRQSDS